MTMATTPSLLSKTSPGRTCRRLASPNWVSNETNIKTNFLCYVGPFLYFIIEAIMISRIDLIIQNPVQVFL